jgi:hypothetical protein
MQEGTCLPLERLRKKVEPEDNQQMKIMWEQGH